jgi:hypothetical protein
MNLSSIMSHPCTTNFSVGLKIQKKQLFYKQDSMFGFTNKGVLARRPRRGPPPSTKQTTTAAASLTLTSLFDAETAFLDRLWGVDGSSISLASILDARYIPQVVQTRLSFLLKTINTALGVDIESDVSRKDWFTVYAVESSDASRTLEPLSVMTRRMTPFELSIDWKFFVDYVDVGVTVSNFLFPGSGNNNRRKYSVVVTMTDYRGNEFSNSTTGSFSSRYNSSAKFRSSDDLSEMCIFESSFLFKECYGILETRRKRSLYTPPRGEVLETSENGSGTGIIGNNKGSMTIGTYNAIMNLYITEFMKRAGIASADRNIIQEFLTPPQTFTLESKDVLVRSSEELLDIDNILFAIVNSNGMSTSGPAVKSYPIFGRVVALPFAELLMGPSASAMESNTAIITILRSRIPQFGTFLRAALDAMIEAGNTLVKTKANLRSMFAKLATSTDPDELIFAFADEDGDGVLGTREEIDMWAAVVGTYKEAIFTYDGHEGYSVRARTYFSLVQPPLTFDAAEDARRSAPIQLF